VESAPSSSAKPSGFSVSVAPLAAWYWVSRSTMTSSASEQIPTLSFPVSLRSTFKRSRSAHRSRGALLPTTRLLRHEAKAVNQTVLSSAQRRFKGRRAELSEQLARLVFIARVTSQPRRELKRYPLTSSRRSCGSARPQVLPMTSFERGVGSTSGDISV